MASTTPWFSAEITRSVVTSGTKCEWTSMMIGFNCDVVTGVVVVVGAAVVVGAEVEVVGAVIVVGAEVEVVAATDVVGTAVVAGT